VPLFASEVRWWAWGLLAVLALLLIGLSGLNVVNSFVGRDFITSISDRQTDRYPWLALLYFGVFAASTVVNVLERYTEDRIGLFWRQWLARRFIHRYLEGYAYCRIQAEGSVDNPDQRISEDVHNFAVSTLSFGVMVFNSAITACAFLGVLWSITPWLFVFSIVYSAVGSLLTVLLGHRLVNLNNLQLKKEADFRYELVQSREHGENIAMLGGEARQEERLISRLQAAVDNYKAVVGVNRNLGFFTVGYNYLIPFLPLVIAAPLYLRGQIEFGVVTQAAMAFAQVVGAFSLIVLQFSNISVFVAVVNRLGSLQEALDENVTGTKRVIEPAASPVAYHHVTLSTPTSGRHLVQDLSLEIPRGKHLLLIGPNGGGKTALFRATAGFWMTGEGRIHCPPKEEMMFLPQRPHVSIGTLREQLLYTPRTQKPTDQELFEALRALNFESVVERVGGLDEEHDWSHLLSAGELQLLAAARLLAARPAFAFLDEATQALRPEAAARVYRALAASPITYISIGDPNLLLPYHDFTLHLGTDGSWDMAPSKLPADRSKRGTHHHIPWMNQIPAQEGSLDQPTR
jgi:putative ATP-binding cassette transporter